MIAGLALLMIVHEGGHHLVARAFGLRVLRFSIGFGPPIWRHQPKGSDTIYQVALIPFLAYVQVAGMNPFEETDPDDKGSYANATLTARVATVFAGPLANYLFASILFFSAFMIGGKPHPDPTVVAVMEGGAAETAQLKDGDKILTIDGEPINDFEAMREIVLKSPGEALAFRVERDGSVVDLTVTPEPTGEKGGGLIGVRAGRTPMAIGEAALLSFEAPAMTVHRLVTGLARMVAGKEKPDLAGPVGIVKLGARFADVGVDTFLMFLGELSAYLGGFNLLPLPALDGGRLMFLGYEAVARRKPNARVEAHIHFVGMVMFLALIAVVSVFDVQR
jgi:regulator of sigma E protease